MGQALHSFSWQRDPEDMGEAQIVAFLNHLAVQRNVAASTQNQALNALIFLYKQSLGREELALDDITRAKRPERLPTVFDRSEIERLFVLHMDSTSKLVAALLYGAGLRLLEALRLRIQDMEFERSQIIVRNGKEAKDRVTLLPPALVPPIRDQMALAKQLHAQDLAAGLGEVYLPYALACKYPTAARQWGWQYVIPAGNTAVDPRSGKTRRHHLGESAVQRAVKKAIGAAGIHKHGSCHKYDENTRRRYTTVELIEEEIDWNPSPTARKASDKISPERRLGVRVEYWEPDIREKVKATGAIWRPLHKLWAMRYEDVVTLGLEERVVGEQILEP